MAYNYSALYQVETSKHGTSGSLNLRQSSTTTSQLLKQIPNLSPIYCDPNSESNGWIACKHETTMGYAMAKFIQGTTAYGSIPPSPTSNGAGNYSGGSADCRAIVRGGSLNLRASDNASANVICSIPNNTTIYVNADLVATSNWLRALYNKKFGYVQHQYLELLYDDYYGYMGCYRYGTTNLVKGSSGSYVLALTNDLHAYDIGTQISSSFTDNTKEKVKKFQNEYGLTVDGIVGIDTKAALYDFYISNNIG